MEYVRTATFTHLFQKLAPTRQRRVERALEKLFLAFEVRQLPLGLGIKKLRPDLWEVRVDLSERIIFERTGDTVTFLAVGSHDAIRRFLKR